MTARTFHELADLVASLTTPPIGAWWQDNPANDAPCGTGRREDFAREVSHV